MSQYDNSSSDPMKWHPDKLRKEIQDREVRIARNEAKMQANVEAQFARPDVRDEFRSIAWMKLGTDRELAAKIATGKAKPPDGWPEGGERWANELANAALEDVKEVQVVDTDVAPVRAFRELLK